MAFKLNCICNQINKINQSAAIHVQFRSTKFTLAKTQKYQFDNSSISVVEFSPSKQTIQVFVISRGLSQRGHNVMLDAYAINM